MRRQEKKGEIWQRGRQAVECQERYDVWIGSSTLPLATSKRLLGCPLQASSFSMQYSRESLYAWSAERAVNDPRGQSIRTEKEQNSSDRDLPPKRNENPLDFL